MLMVLFLGIQEIHKFHKKNPSYLKVNITEKIPFRAKCRNESVSKAPKKEQYQPSVTKHFNPPRKESHKDH